jgi:phospholipid N-methyltransferase
MIKMSENLKKEGMIKILEPTAGSGNLVLEIIKNRIEDYNIDMVELNNDNRIFLKEKICKLAPNII